MSKDLKQIFRESFLTVAAIFAVLVAILIIGQPVSASELLGTDSQDAFAVGINPSRDYLILVNDANPYVFGGSYDQALQPDIIYVSDCYGDPTAIEKGTNTAFTMLKQHLVEQGIYIELFSGYRTEPEQQWVYDYYGNLEGWKETNKVAEAGFSEHHTGLLLNIVVYWPEIEDWATITPERIAENPEFFGTAYYAIRDALADYGFIERYPAGKEEVTGYPSEPYEIRFVGYSPVAHAIMDNGLTLEEYLTSR